MTVTSLQLHASVFGVEIKTWRVTFLHLTWGSLTHADKTQEFEISAGLQLGFANHNIFQECNLHSWWDIAVMGVFLINAKQIVRTQLLWKFVFIKLQITWILMLVS